MSINYEDIDPGIRDAVRTINEMGFTTTDSGDGTADMECAIGFRHVFLCGNLNHIHTDLQRLTVEFPDAHIEASYALNEPVVIAVMWPPEGAPSQSTDGIAELARRIHQNAVEHGWWECPTCKGEGRYDVGARSVAEWVDCATCCGSGKHRNVGESIALIHSEVSEALEAKREPDHDALCDKCGGDGRSEYIKNGGSLATSMTCRKCGGSGEALGGSRFGEELADVIIRVLDLAVGEGIDIGAAIQAKHAYNKTRPYKHGKAF